LGLSQRLLAEKARGVEVKVYSSFRQTADLLGFPPIVHLIQIKDHQTSGYGINGILGARSSFWASTANRWNVQSSLFERTR